MKILYNSFGSEIVVNEGRFYAKKSDGYKEITKKEMEKYYNEYKTINMINRPSILFIMMDIIGKNGSNYLQTKTIEDENIKYKDSILEQIKGI